MGRQPQNLRTLGVFIEQGIARGLKFPMNAYVTAYGFSTMYVRMTRRWIDKVLYEPVLDLATLEARKPGNGAFTKLIAKLREQYPALHIYVEQVLNERFGARLVKLGFTKLDPTIHGESYFLKARNQS